MAGQARRDGVSKDHRSIRVNGRSRRMKVVANPKQVIVGLTVQINPWAIACMNQ
jgi:hypothetical protein